MDEQSQHSTDENTNKTQRQRRPVTNKTLERLSKISEEIMKNRGGKPFEEDSTEILRQEREKRTRHLMQVATGQYEEEEEENTPTEQNVLAEESMKHQKRPATRKMLEELRQVREAIIQDRNEQLFEDSTEMIRQMREERSQELEQL